MATQDDKKKAKTKPFKGVRPHLIFQAQVHWPPEMPDDILEDAVTTAKTVLDAHDFTTDGVEVRLSSEANALRSSSRSNSIWTRSGDPTGMFSAETPSAATRFTRRTVSCISRLSSRSYLS